MIDADIPEDTLEPAWFTPGAARWEPARFSHYLARDLSDHALRLPPEPMFSQAELTAAGRDAYSAGRALGLAEASASREAVEVAAMTAVAEALRETAAEVGRVADEAAGALARVMVAAMHAALPNLIERTQLSETNAMLNELLPGLSREPHVEVTVPQGLEACIEAMLDGLPASDRNRIFVIGSGALETGETRIAWSAGHAKRQPTQIWRAIMNTLEPALDDPKIKDRRDV